MNDCANETMNTKWPSGVCVCVCVCVCAGGEVELNGSYWRGRHVSVLATPTLGVCVFTFESLREEMVDEEATVSQRVRHKNKLTLQQIEAKLASCMETHRAHYVWPGIILSLTNVLL